MTYGGPDAYLNGVAQSRVDCPVCAAPVGTACEPGPHPARIIRYQRESFVPASRPPRLSRALLPHQRGQHPR